MATSSSKEIKQGNVVEAGAGWSENPGGRQQGGGSSREQSAETSSLCVRGTAEPHRAAGVGRVRTAVGTQGRAGTRG